MNNVKLLVPLVISGALTSLLTLALPAWATPITWDFSIGTDTGGAVGSFTYDSAATPILTNSLGGFVYAPTNWDFQVRNTFIGDMVFSSSRAGQSAEWCVGGCTFLSGQQVRLDLRDGAGLWFHFSFGLTEPVTQLTAINQVGGFGQAAYEDRRFEGTTRVSVFREGGTLTQAASVPEPSSMILLALGFILMALSLRPRNGWLVH